MVQLERRQGVDSLDPSEDEGDTAPLTKSEELSQQLVKVRQTLETERNSAAESLASLKSKYKRVKAKLKALKEKDISSSEVATEDGDAMQIHTQQQLKLTIDTFKTDLVELLSKNDALNETIADLKSKVNDKEVKLDKIRALLVVSDTPEGPPQHADTEASIVIEQPSLSSELYFRC